jgi:hypothetical protein
VEAVDDVGDVGKGVDELADVLCDDVVLFTKAIPGQLNSVNPGTIPKLTCGSTSWAPKLLQCIHSDSPIATAS